MKLILWGGSLQVSISQLLVMVYTYVLLVSQIFTLYYCTCLWFHVHSSMSLQYFALHSIKDDQLEDYLQFLLKGLCYENHTVLQTIRDYCVNIFKSGFSRVTPREGQVAYCSVSIEHGLCSSPHTSCANTLCQKFVCNLRSAFKSSLHSVLIAPFLGCILLSTHEQLPFPKLIDTNSVLSIFY